jgi:hypothetical protein
MTAGGTLMLCCIASLAHLLGGGRCSNIPVQSVRIRPAALPRRDGIVIALRSPRDLNCTASCSVRCGLRGLNERHQDNCCPSFPKLRRR